MCEGLYVFIERKESYSKSSVSPDEKRVWSTQFDQRTVRHNEPGDSSSILVGESPSLCVTGLHA